MRGHGRVSSSSLGDAWTLDVETWTWRESTATTTPRDFACVVHRWRRDHVRWVRWEGMARDGGALESRRMTRDDGRGGRRPEVEPAKVETLEAVTSVGSARVNPREGVGRRWWRSDRTCCCSEDKGRDGAKAFSDAWCLKRERDGWRWVKLALRGHARRARGAGHAMSVIAVETPGGYAPNVVVAGGGVGDDGWLVKETSGLCR